MKSNQKLRAKDTSPWVSSQVAAQHFAVHAKTLNHMANQGELPIGSLIRIGCSWKFKISKLEDHFSKIAEVKCGNV